MTNEEHIKVFDRGFAEGRAFGVRDVVLQDEDRIALAMATLVAEAYLVANNEEHTCYTAGPLAGNEKTDWRRLPGLRPGLSDCRASSTVFP